MICTGKIASILLIQLFCLSPLLGQNKTSTTLYGFVYDLNTKEVLIGATVYAPSTKQGAITNEYGFYSLTLPAADSLMVYVSVIGYKTDTNKIAENHKNQIDFYLSFHNVLQEVVISSSQDDNNVNRNETSVVRIPMKDIRALPNLFGEVDIIKAYQLTPGVQSGGEAKSNMYVRGGSPDQNLILLDEVPLYNITHFGGFVSIFNVDAINNVKLIKGGFPARYGGRLSSILDVRMKDGNMQKLGVQGAVGLLSSKISVEAPLLKDKLSFIVSARKNTLPLFKILQAGINHSFYDINFKLNYKISLRDRLFLSFYTGDDVVYTKVKQDNTENKNAVKWGNTLGAFRWNHIFNDKLFSNVTVSDTYYRYRTIFDYSISSDSTSKQINSSLNSGINDLSGKMDFTYLLSSKISMKYGINSTLHHFIPNDQRYVQSNNNVETINKNYISSFNALENAGYAESEFKLKMISTNLGIRYSIYQLKNKSYDSFEPRALLNLILREDISIKYSFAKMNQYVHLLTYSGTGVPSDYWMPTNENIKPETAFQHTLSLDKTFNRATFEITIEGYYKAITNLITFRPGESLLGNFDSWEKVVEKNGKGTNYGIEFFLQKIKGNTTGWIGATVSKAERVFLTLNNGEAYPFKYDRPLDFSFVLNHKFKKNTTLSLTWSYGTGYPITLAVESYNINGEDIFVYDKMNSYRMRDYHRLDLAANFPKKTKWGERTWSISVLNVYNRKNPYYYFYERRLPGSFFSSPKGQLGLYQRSLFGILPTLSYSFKF